MQEENGGNDASRCNRSEDLPLSLASSSSSRNKIKKNGELSDDLLDIICEKLNFDDLFQFAGVCRSWRLCSKTFWKTFMSSKSPFIVQKASHDQKSLSFISLPDRKLHSLKMDKFLGFSYCESSSGYLIFTGPDTLLLMNPFKRRQKEVSTLDLEIKSDYKAYRALLAFVKGSEEFVIVFYSKSSLNVYQSQNYLWATYLQSNFFSDFDFVDIAVFHNAIYVLTSDAMIGVLNLGWSSVSINFLQLKNTPRVNCVSLRLVRDDDKLRVVNFTPKRILDVYEIDFSKMEYVKLNTLGDLALFYSPWASCHALSNPSMWGYYSNHVYSICTSRPKCEVYSWSNNLVDFYEHDHIHGLQVPYRSRLYWRDWCFRNLHEEVEHSLIYKPEWWTLCLP